VEVQEEREHHTQAAGERRNLAEERRIRAELEVDNHLGHHNQFAREVHNCSAVDKGLSGADIAVQGTQWIVERPGLERYCCKGWQGQSQSLFQGQAPAEEAGTRQ
jgi:hypothetical protein